MVYLIDGYNLMHAVGLASRSLPAGRLDRARTRFLDWLADAAAGRAGSLRVVFDAGKVTTHSPERVHRGVRVLFATGRTADELIEELVEDEPRPALLTVVSNDGQVRESGRRRGCGVFECEEFVDWLIAERGPEAVREPGPEKPVPEVSAAEQAAWLAAFSQPKKKR